MKISNKEKIMLCVLGSIVVGFIYYQFVYLSQTNEIQAKIKAESEIKQKYDNAMKTINSMEDRKSDIKILNAKIRDGSLPFYPTISQEHIIVELDKLLKDSELEGGITFAPIASSSVESSKKEEKVLAESSLQGIVDKYNNAFKDTEKAQQSNDKTVENSTKSENNNSNGTNDINVPNNSNENSKKDPKKNTVQYLKCEVKFQGNYEGIVKFLNTIGKNEKKIVVNSIKLNSNTLNGIQGTLSLEIYSIPKIDDELESYLKWDFNKNYGKNVPFGAATAGTSASTSLIGEAANPSTSIEESKEPGDFIASVKSINSDLPTIILGKTDDRLRTTYVYADSDSEEKVEMILTQDGNKYYYKYKTSKGTFPANYDSLGTEFAPISKNIVLDILSEGRVTGSDNSGIDLKIINKTDKSVVLNIIGDDYTNPRVKVDANSNNVIVNKN